ncbi:hypothetical protein ANCDUO_05242 [Ancylostoma duodenale]|uniref:Uncharacterized protein n=1 Tax=Ancylostoma duodenale TaxID=51022 RepID=A0A0C2H501_9BILA|nr:hypothetical protein ANCDUO_05242 [Ancylostoma duodenale]
MATLLPQKKQKEFRFFVSCACFPLLGHSNPGPEELIRTLCCFNAGKEGVNSKMSLRRAEEELRREAAEISRLLNPPKVEVPYTTWLWSLFGCSLVVLSGILPALILPANSSEYLQTQGRSQKC